MDAAVRLQPSQDVGGDEAAEGCEWLLLPRLQLLDECVEHVARAKQAGVEEVEERPQVSQAVLDRRAGQGDAGAGRQRAHRPALAGRRVLDGLCLVQNDESPLHCCQPGLSLEHGVGSHGQIDTVQPPRR